MFFLKPLLLLVALAACGVTHATVITYSDRTTWESAVNSFTNIDFEGLAVSGSFEFYGSSGLQCFQIALNALLLAQVILPCLISIIGAFLLGKGF